MEVEIPHIHDSNSNNQQANFGASKELIEDQVPIQAQSEQSTISHNLTTEQLSYSYYEGSEQPNYNKYEILPNYLYNETLEEQYCSHYDRSLYDIHFDKSIPEVQNDVPLDLSTKEREKTYHQLWFRVEQFFSVLELHTYVIYSLSYQLMKQICEIFWAGVHIFCIIHIY